MEKMRDSRESASGRAGGVSPSRVSIVDEKTLSSTVSQRRLSVQEVAKKLVQEKSRTFLTKRKESVNEFKQELSIDDHIVSLPELSKRYEVDLELGHSEEKALELLSKNGPNALRPPKLKSRWVLFLQYMFYGFSSLLWIGALMSIGGYVMAKLEDAETSMDQLYLGIVIVVVILITGVFGFYQESANSAIMESFKKMIPKNATVVREGGKYVIPSEQIVLGDLVQVKAGDCVPADIRIILAVSLKVDNSSITGESEPQARLAEMTDMNPLETANLAFYGTNVVEGSGVGVVIACGDNTLMGHIAALTSGLVPEKTPIKKELSRFTLIVTIIALVCGAVFFGICLLLGYTFFEAFLYFIAVCVANVPEGLLVTMTACLTLTARKMARKNCLCKNLLAIETLGSTTVICSDKTGTLTQNRMTVSHMYYDSVVYDVMSETKYYNENSTAFKLLCRVGILCSRAEFKPNQEEVDVMKREVIGDASESAVIKCMELLVGQTDSIRHEYEKIFEIPFNSTNKYQISIHKIPNSEGLLLVMKGAPERLIERSSHMFTNEGVEEISAKTKKKLKMALLEIGYMGERVLGFADLELPPEYNANYTFTSDPVNFPVSGLRFMGYMSMIDPPRPGVPMAVQKCKSAGIKVVMVTGDHPITAMAIARKVGIISPQNETVHDIAMRRNVSANKITEAEVARCKASVITGTELREMDDEDLADVIRKYEEIVFARTSPQQKLQIVEAFQKAKNIVAVTGDGVNDSPALKKADIGIAMGITGSDVSKEAADMIILDDNFASIVIGIEEGRLIFDNLKKSIAYMFTSNVPELVPFLLHVIIGIPLPLSIMAILVIDVGTDLWPGISLAYEIAEADIMHKKPRNPKKDRLVSAKLLYFANFNIGIIQAFAGLTCYFYVMAEHGFLPERLLWIREEWMSERNDLKDSYSIEWTREERIVLEKKCYSAFFMAVVMTQIADCIICKTRRLSIVEQGMSNVVMNCGLLFEVVLAFLVVYCPGLNSLLGFEPVRLYVMVPGLPFALMIIAFDEIRKYFIRTRPGGFMERETAF